MANPKKQYPYQNFSLEDMPGEVWKELPLFDGIFRISNLGRVKRFETETENGKGYLMRLPEKIIKSYANKALNIGMKDVVYSINVAISRSKVRYKYSVPRLVYYCFIKKFDLDDHLLVILPKDGNGQNIQLPNLVLSDHRGKQNRIFERKRWLVKKETSYDEYLKGKITSKNISSKQISQYNRIGKLLQTYPSIAAASKATAIREVGILAVLKQRNNFAGGFHWAYGKQKKADVVSRRIAILQDYKLLVGRKVTQFDLSGKRLQSYLTVKDAALENNVNSSDIHAVLNGRQRSAGGFIWRAGNSTADINMKGILTGEAWRTSRLKKRVAKFNLTGKLLQTFDSVKEAAQKTGVSSSTISTAISQKRVYRNSIWRFEA